MNATDTSFPILKHYKIIELLGEGSFGKVYKAIQNNTNQHVAIKILKFDHTANPRQLARFEREVRICADISHPYIVRLIDKGYSEGNIPFVVFEYVSGITLKNLLLHKGPLSSYAVKELMGQLLDALVCAHEKGIVHRDLKPENIMITKTGSKEYVKVLDFGIGVFIQDAFKNKLYQQNDTIGTPAYSAPEQLRGEPPTIKSDLYAWALLLLECLTGKPAIQGDSIADIFYQQLKTSVIPIPSFLFGHPLYDLLQRVLDKNPHTRISNTNLLFHSFSKIDFSTLPCINIQQNGKANFVDHTVENHLALYYEKKEKRQITVLCIKIGLQVSGEVNTDEEVLEELQRDQLAICTDIAVRFGGYAKGAFADHVMIYFGYPRTSDNDARLAGRTALEILMVIKKRSEQLFTQHNVNLDVRLAIHTGTIISRDNNVPEGLTANTAFNLLYQASSNRILISELSGKLLEPYIELEKYKSIKFPDIPEEIKTYYILRERPAEAFSQLRHSSFNRKMHGRDNFLRTIRKRFDAINQTEGQVILIKGEAGIGKSKLLYEVRKTLKENNCLELRCLPEYKNTALYSVFGILKQYYRLHRDSTVKLPINLLEQMLFEAGCDVTKTLPVLLSWFGIDSTRNYPAPQGSPCEQKKILFQALKKCISHISNSHKFLLIIEDLHWLDPTSEEFLHELIGSSYRKNILFLFSARPEFIPEWPECDYSVINLEPLKKDMAEDIVKDLLDNKSIERQSLDYIVDSTDGIPLFIEELTTMLLSKKLLIADNQIYTLVNVNLPLNVPVTLKELLSSRFDDMGLAKETAQLAATIGREFQFALLAKISLKDESNIQEDLDQLVKADILYPVRTEQGQAYIFRHALFCEVIYNSQVAISRRSVHLAIAEVLEKLVLSNSNVSAFELETLARHLYGATKKINAVDWLIKSMDMLLKTSGNKECIALCHKALVWLQELPESAARNGRELSVRQLLLSNLIVLESYGSDAVGEQLNIMNELFEESENSQIIIPGMFVYTNYFAMRGNWRRATDIAFQLYEKSCRYQNSRYFMVSSVFLGLQLFNDGRLLEASKILKEALGQYEAENHDHLAYDFGIDQEVLGLCTLANIYALCGKKSEIPNLVLRAKIKAHKINHHNTKASLYLGLSCIYYYLSDKTSVQNYSQKLLSLNARTNLNMFGNYAAILNSWSLNDLHRAKNALIKEEESGMQSMRSFWHSVIGSMEIDGGFYEDAHKRLSYCLSFIGTTDGSLYCAEIYRLLGLISLARQNYDQAIWELKKACKIASEQNAILINSKALEGLKEAEGQHDKFNVV